MPIDERMAQCQARLPTLLKKFLPVPLPGSPPLYAAMQYACLNGGKRFRPLLVYTTAELFGTPWEQVDPTAVAIELIHCYSLIHDDLPAMDDDDFRRGKPTCHKVYGEATAILAGDALLTLAFEVLATQEHYPAMPQSGNKSVELNIIKILAQAAGNLGMIHGQALDLAAEGHTLTVEQLMQMHRAKTGALITASIQCGALGTAKANAEEVSQLTLFGEAIGLCFQIQDDILDATGTYDMTGKHPGQDMKKHKCTFVTLLGLEQARSYARQYGQDALAYLKPFGETCSGLRALTQTIIERVG